MKVSALIVIPIAAKDLKAKKVKCAATIAVGTNRAVIGQFADVGHGLKPTIKRTPIPKTLTLIIAGKARRTDDFGNEFEYITVGDIKRETFLALIEPFDVICAFPDDTPVILYWSEATIRQASRGM